MNVSKIETEPITKVEPRKMTETDLQRDFDYMMAQKLTKKLMDQGLITVDEFNKISALNCRKFSPYMAELLA